MIKQKVIRWLTNFWTLQQIFSSVSSKIHESIPSPISEDDFSYYLRNIQMSTPFSSPTTQITEGESTILSLKENKTHVSTYPNKIPIANHYYQQIFNHGLFSKITRNCTNSANIQNWWLKYLDQLLSYFYSSYF